MLASHGGGDLVEAVPLQEMRKIAECPVCNAVPLPPIFNCVEGHIVCGKCRPKIPSCPICNGRYIGSRNFFAEEIVQSLNIACDFPGCNSTLKGDKFQSHVESCRFRPKKCTSDEGESRLSQLVLELLQEGNLKGTIPTHDMQRIAECPICQGVPLPPIFNCTNGHIVCGQCRPKVTVCGLCKADYTGTHNLFAEEIVRTMKFACDFREHGCTLILSGGVFQEHVENCKFNARPFECIYGDFDGCNHSIVNRGNYVGHLRSVHSASFQLLTGSFNSAGKGFLHHLEMDVEICTFRDSKIVYYMLNHYLFGTFLQEDVLHFIVCLIGSKRDAAGYGVRIQLRRNGFRDEKPFMDVSIPIAPSHEILKEKLSECLHLSVPKAMIMQVCGVDGRAGKRYVSWNVEYTILSRFGC